MKKLFSAIVLTWCAAVFVSAITYTTGTIRLEKPVPGEAGSNWPAAINRNFDILSASAAVSGSASTATHHQIFVDTITALGTSVYVSSPVTHGANVTVPTITGTNGIMGTVYTNTITPQSGATVTVSSGLTVQGGGGVTATYGITGASFTASGATPRLTFDETDNTPIQTFVDGGMYNWETGLGSYAHFAAGTVADSFITPYSDGKLGIGTTAPGYKLDVIGAAGFHASTTATAGYGLYVDADGQVGVGTSAPAENFVVASGTANVLGALKVGNGTSTMALPAEAGYVEGTLEVDGVASFGGNVGIGTTGPRGSLDVNGVVYSTETRTSGSSYVTGYSVLSAGWYPAQKTKAQFDTLDPIIAGEYYYCTNCTIPGLCVSSGAAVAQFRKDASATTGCGSNE